MIFSLKHIFKPKYLLIPVVREYHTEVSIFTVNYGVLYVFGFRAAVWRT